MLDELFDFSKLFFKFLDPAQLQGDHSPLVKIGKARDVVIFREDRRAGLRVRKKVVRFIAWTGLLGLCQSLGQIPGETMKVGPEEMRSFPKAPIIDALGLLG